MAYETFRLGSHLLSSRGTTPQIRCGPQRICFNKAATALLDKSRVILLWDREAGRFAVQPTDDKSGYPLTKNKTISQSCITCTAFLRATGLAELGIVEATWDANRSLLEWTSTEIIEGEK